MYKVAIVEVNVLGDLWGYIPPYYLPYLLQHMRARSFRYLLESLQVNPEQVVHVGDNVKLDGEIPLGLGSKAILMDREGKIRRSDSQCEIIRNLDDLMVFLR